MRVTRVHRMIAAGIIWAGALITIDHFFNKHIYRDSAAAAPLAGRPQITLRINHLCCQGCYDATFQAMKQFSWLGAPRVLKPGALPTPQAMDQGKASPGPVTPPSAYGGGVIVDVNPRQMPQVDLVKFVQAIRSAGLVPDQIKLLGIPHFELQAYLPHFCCGGCVDAVKETFAPTPGSGQPPAPVIAGLEGPPESSASLQQVTAPFVGQADVTGFLGALERTGFAPQWVHVIVLP